MRKLTLVLAAVIALVVAGLAVAHGSDGTKSASLVAGTFTATTATNVETRTCTTSDGKAIAVTRATYAGTAAGAADLAGPITLKVRSLINTTDGVGVVSGRLSIDTAAEKNTGAQFTSVYDHGKLAGVAEGRVQDKHVQLLANLSAGFTAAGGFTDGKLGATTGGSAVELGPGKCVSTPKETSSAHGSITAVSATSISVAGLTCDVPATFDAAKIAALKVGDRVEIGCSLVSGKNTLVKLGGKKGEKRHK
jgi:hypothetical protein